MKLPPFKKSAVLSVVVNDRGLRFQWLTFFNEDRTIDIKTRVGAGDIAGPWSEAYHISLDDLDHEPDMGHNVPFALGPSAVTEILNGRTANEVIKSPPPEWKPVKWFESDLPTDISVHVMEGFEDM